MARVDRILALVKEQGANELRMGSNVPPQMLAHGAPRKLSIPTTDNDTLRDLLGELLSADREQLLRAQGRIEVVHDVEGVGAHRVVLSARGDDLDVVFVRNDGGRIRPSPTKVSEPVATEPTAAFAPPEALEPREELHVELTLLGGDVQLAPSLLAMLEPLPPRTSDVHLAEGDLPRLRVDGVLSPLEGAAPANAALFVLDPAAEQRLQQQRSLDGAASLSNGTRLRVHVYYTDSGRAMALRVLPRLAPSLASLQMPVPLEPLVGLPHGLVLICGATGSGKSTTLAALTREVLNRRSVVVTTLEDPIEYALTAPTGSVLRRRQIGRDVSDFASGLRDALRQDPDVIVLGELRDAATIELALTAAETGHLVLSSMHSGSAASAIERIVDAYPPMRAQQIRVQLADVLRAVVAQRLLPRARGAGRCVALEVMLGNSAVASLIREGKTAQLSTTIQAARREGMITLERSLADRVIAGDVRIEDARAAANQRGALEALLNRAG